GASALRPRVVRTSTGRSMTTAAAEHAGDTRLFRHGLIAPAVFVMALMTIFPFVYVIVVSFQRISLSDEITSFSGLVTYARIFGDARLWDAVLHTVLITALALPIELRS